MHPLQFRVYDKQTGQMSPSFTLFGEFTLLGAVHAWQHDCGNKSETSLKALGDLEIMSFTGLKDKDGNDIYEGDVVACVHEMILPNWDGWGRDIPNPGPPQTQTNLERYEVFYDDSRGEFRMREIKYNNTRNLYERTNLEVIGNIYQHKHLLK